MRLSFENQFKIKKCLQFPLENCQKVDGRLCKTVKIFK